ncbi:MAG: MFS transporter [Acidothermaceae bacterium]
MSVNEFAPGRAVPRPRRTTLSTRGRLPAAAAFYLQASILVFFLAGSSAPTPLYALYQAKWGFSPITTTVVFGIYALAVLAALLVVGSLSDHVGRRPVLLVAVAAQAVTMLIFATADGVPALLVARVVQGLSTGAAAGAIGAGLLDLHKARGTIANAIAPLLGTASGAIGSGLLVQYLPAPTHLVYLSLFGIFLVQGIGLVFMAESATQRPGALASLRPQFGLPDAVRRPALLAIPMLVAVWALPGFYGSVGPALIRRIAGSNSALLGGFGLFILAVGGAASVAALRSVSARGEMVFGSVAVLVGVAATLIAVANNSTIWFFVATAVAGSGFGAGFQGAIRTVLPLAAAHQRAGVLSILYVVSYLAMGLPAVIAGFLVVDGGGVIDTAREYGFGVLALAGIALAGLATSNRRARSPQPVAMECPTGKALARAS